MDRPSHGLRSAAQLPRILVALLADGHVVYSEEGKNFLCRFIDPDRVRVVRNTLALTHPAIPTVRRRPNVGAALVSIGRFTPDKQFPALIRIFKQLRRHLPNATLTIVGNGPDDARVRAEAGDLLDRCVFLPGSIYDEDQLTPHFAKADIAVFAGAVGLSVNHALLHGLPVIAFDRTAGGPYHHPEIAYVVDRVTGQRVRPFNETAMVNALASFFQNHPDPRRDFQDRIDTFVKRHLLIDRMVEDFGHVREMVDCS
jgi:glycosyltransferase involved in cell wall biosynthesis